MKCGAMYHVENAKSKREGYCDQCGSSLSQRDDDKVEIIKKRLEVYRQQTEPVVGFYKQQSNLLSLDAAQSAKQVSQTLADILG